MLKKIFIAKNRNTSIQRVSLMNILVNMVLTIIKTLIGLLSGSFSIILDSINNLTDSISSAIILIGMKISNKKPNEKHPFGYGRFESITSLFISILLIFIGLQTILNAIDRIRFPQTLSITFSQIILLLLTFFVKIIISKINHFVGKETDSIALKGSGLENLIDAFGTLLTIFVSTLFILTSINLDGIVSLFLAIILTFLGVKQMVETISDILGTTVDKQIIEQIHIELQQFPQIQGAFDFIIHNYGATHSFGTANLEFFDTTSVEQAYQVIRALQQMLYQKYHLLFVFGIYSINTKNKKVQLIERTIRDIALEKENIIGLHAFYFNEETHDIRFDMIHSFHTKNLEEDIKQIKKQIHHVYSDINNIEINVDFDFS